MKKVPSLGQYQKTQVNLLRFIQEREFRRVGGKDPIKVDIRIIVATNKNLEKMITNGAFREDLYYRLNVIAIEVPPLRERKEDIPLLAEHFLDKFSLDIGKKIYGLSDESMRILMEYNWPGNIRQLANTIEHAIVVANELEIQVCDFPGYIVASKAEDTTKAATRETPQSLEELEKEYMMNTLRINNWNIRKSADILGINRVTLYNKIKKYGLKKSKIK
jgi:transcriptional regulator with PAS, ATPase and Fis domain